MARKKRSAPRRRVRDDVVRERPGASCGKEIEQIRKGFSWKRVDHFQKAYNLKDKRFARIIGISDRTLTRHRKEEEPLDPVASDRFYRMAKIIRLSANVFEDGERAMRWLGRAQPGLAGMVPLEILDTEPGAHAVERLLTQIEHGVLP